MGAMHTEAAWWSPYIGDLAVLVYAVCLIGQLRAVWHYRADDAALRASARPMVVACNAVTALMWCVYGLRFDAPAIAAAHALVLVGLCCVTVVCVRRRLFSQHTVVTACVGLSVAALLFTASSQTVLGCSAAVMTVLLWLPAAVSGIGANNTVVLSRRAWLVLAALEPKTAVLTHAVWLLYGVGMGDVWLWIPAPAVIACAGLALWSVGVMRTVRPLDER